MKIILISLIIINTFLVASTSKFDKLWSNVYVYHGPTQEPNAENKGFINNPALIVGKRSLIVIDPGGNYPVGKMILSQIEKISNKPISVVFNTHMHGDHWLGNQAIVEKYPNVKIYAHPKMIEHVKDFEGKFWVKSMHTLTKGYSKGTKAVFPTHSVKHLQKINVDGEEFIIHSFSKYAHTDNDIFIEHKKSKTLFLGDNVFLNRIGQFGEVSSIIGTIKNLEYAKKLNIKVYVPGHGLSGGFNQSVSSYLNYLSIIKDEGIKAYNNDKHSYEIKNEVSKKLINYHKWVGYDKFMGKHLSKILLEIEALELQ